MFSKPKGSRRKYLSEIILVFLDLKKLGQLHSEITYHLEIPKSSITTILYRKARQSDNLLKTSKQPSCFPKLDSRAQQAIIRHVEKFAYDNLYVLSTFSKSGDIIGQTTI